MLAPLNIPDEALAHGARGTGRGPGVPARVGAGLAAGVVLLDGGRAAVHRVLREAGQPDLRRGGVERVGFGEAPPLHLEKSALHS